jgi:hypothetical protein
MPSVIDDQRDPGVDRLHGTLGTGKGEHHRDVRVAAMVSATVANTGTALPPVTV